MNDLAALLPLVGIALLFWFLIVRPQSRRQRDLRALQQSLQIGDEVVLAAGIFGTVRTLDADKVGLEIADGVVVTAARGSVVSRSEAEVGD